MRRFMSGFISRLMFRFKTRLMTGLWLGIASTFLIAACGEKNMPVEGTYRRIDKVDTVNGDVHTYQKGTSEYKRGIRIQRKDDKLYMEEVNILSAKKIIPHPAGKKMPLTNPSVDTYVYREGTNMGDITLTLYVSDEGIELLEFQKQKNLTQKMGARYHYKKHL